MMWETIFMLIVKLFQQPKYVVSLFVNVIRVLSYDVNDAVYQYWFTTPHTAYQ